MLHPVAAALLTASEALPPADATFQLPKVRPFIAANGCDGDAAAALPSDHPDVTCVPGWVLSADGAYAMHTSKFGYVSVFPLRFEREGVEGVHPDLDLSRCDLWPLRWASLLCVCVVL